MRRGVSFQETMAGSYHLASSPGDERALSFTIGARSPSLLDFVRRPITEIEGEIFAEGLARHRHLRGTLELDILRTGKLRYAFDFTGDDGAAYSLKGEKTLRASALAESMSVLPASITDAGGAAVGEALLRFDLRSDLGRFIKHFHVRW